MQFQIAREQAHEQVRAYSFARHGTYMRKTPRGVRVARWYCPESRTIFSLLPDCPTAWLSESANEGAVGEWMRQVYVPGRSAAATWPVAENRPEAQIMLRERVKEWMEEERSEGLAEDRARQVELMRRMAARKFGSATADRLVERLNRVHDPERMVEIGEWLIECESGEELLERFEGVHPPPPAGQESARRSIS